MKNIFGNRTILGIICIVAALIICFAVAPLVNRMADNRVDVVRIAADITQGRQITEKDIEIVTIGAYNLPEGVITDKEAVINKYAAADMTKGDYLFKTKLADTADSADEVFRTLDGTRQAMSITIQSFAGGLSGKLNNGDIVSLIVYTNDEDEVIIPEALQYMRVITTTTANGFDKDELIPNEDGTYELPTTLSLLVTPMQSKLLAKYENAGKIHATLVYRGDADKAKEFLLKQDLILEELKIAEEEAEKANEGEVDVNG